MILFDDLVSDEVLELARREAKRILVGKRAGRPSCQQSEINDLMVTLAKAGRRVIRLKSGDPMVFGRADEEMAALDAHNIPHDVVPGITAGLALATSLKTSLTHREAAKSVRFVTGHSKAGGLPEDLDWRAVADPSATTVFYMGAKLAGEIAARLIAYGLAPDTPVALGEVLGRPVERVQIVTLATLAEAAARRDPAQPVVIAVGQVFRLAAEAARQQARAA
ncbi:MAG TPA: uroporphyrinogen-III C-methyltransferase [Rubellimicrobium sp.]|nr:uroporphyrinogen-III C-methyltransferase [Rubellimicrobium sp.]